MSSWNSIRVEHRDQNKYKIFPKEISSGIFFVKQELHNSFECIAGRCLNRMYSCGYKYNRFVASISNNFLICQSSFNNFIALPSFMRRYHQHINNPSLIRFGQFILPQQQFFIVLIFLSSSDNLRSALFVRVRINECKLNTFQSFYKRKIKFKY